MSLRKRIGLLLELCCVAMSSGSNTTVDLGDLQLGFLPFDMIPADTVKLLAKNNSIAALPYFPPYSYMEIVHLNQNFLTVVPDFTNISGTLEKLMLASNRIATVSESSIQILRKLRVLSLWRNRITSPFPDMDLTIGTELKILNLMFNRLTGFPRLNVIGAGLLELHMGGNSIQDEGDFSALGLYPNLQKLRLSSCNLTDMPDLTGLLHNANNTALYIDLSNNKLNRLPTAALSNLTGTEWTFDLSNNSIGYLPNMMFAKLDSRFNIDVQGNPLNCERGASWINWVQHTGRLNITGYPCQFDGSRDGTTTSESVQSK